MADNWSTDDMANALQDVSNGIAEGAPANNHGTEEKINPQERGWVEPQAYNYDSGKADGASHSNDPNAPTWAHNFMRYEWKDEYGDVGPEIPELEKDLFHNEYITRRGIKFDDLLVVKVVAEAQDKPAPVRDFKSAGLHPVVLDNVQKCGYEIPTPIQAYTIPAVLKGHDVIATAQTGSGKTAAFLIPAISKLMGKVKNIAAPRPGATENGTFSRVRAEPLILVVAPTRELCCQIFDEARRLCYRSMLRPCVLYGGAPTREQRDELRKGCDVLIATPGRLLDFMNDTNLLSLCRLRYTIIDEADEMLHEDWEEEMGKILMGADANQSSDHHYLLFSATFNKRMRKLAKKFLANDHVRIRIGRSGAVLNNVKQRIVYVDRNKKQTALFDLLVDTPPARTMVFVKSKKTADFVDDFLYNSGLPSTSIHSDRTQREREDSIRAFRIGNAPILVTTGVAARGIDVRNVMHVINFDLPSADYGGQDEYIHRIGRTARIGNEGLATSFYNDDDEPLAQFLVNTLIECKQEVPDFLSQYKPTEESKIDWNDDSAGEDDEEAAGDNDGGAGWGATNGDTADTGAGDQAWGSGDGGAPVTNDAWNSGDAAGTAINDWGTTKENNAATSGTAW